jgi:hypothetical protein
VQEGNNELGLQRLGLFIGRMSGPDDPGVGRIIPAPPKAIWTVRPDDPERSRAKLTDGAGSSVVWTDDPGASREILT